MPRRSHAQSDDGSQSSINQPKQKRRRLIDSSQVEICQVLMDQIRAFRDDDGVLTDFFMRIPSKRSNPEYFETVTNPIDLARIQLKVKNGDYNSLESMLSDLSLLITNTKSFYSQSSDEYAKAEALQQLIDKESSGLEQSAGGGPPSVASSTSGSVSGSRGRRRRVAVKEEDIGDEDEEFESASVAASDDSRLAPSDSSVTNLTSSTQRSVGSSLAGATSDNPQELFFALIAKYKTDQGKALAPTFTYLPSRQLYPIYYDVIKDPIDLRLIARRVLANAYSSSSGLDEMERDFVTMARNAKAFNEPKSSIYQDAAMLLRIVKGKRSEAEHPPTRTSRDRSSRKTGRLNFNPHDLVEEFASLMDQPNVSSFDDSNEDVEDPVVDNIEEEEDSTQLAPTTTTTTKTEMEDEDTQLTAASNLSSSAASSTASTPTKKKRGRKPKSEQASPVDRPSGSPFSPSSSSMPPLVGGTTEQPQTPLGEVPNSPATTPVHSIASSTTSSSTVKRGPARYRPGTLKWCQASILHSVLDYRNEADHLVCTPFIRLPSKKIYPDYYDEIANPISLGDIKRNLKQNVYPNLESIWSDLNLVFRNAQQYNLEESLIHREAVFLQKLAAQKYSEMLNVQVKAINQPIGEQQLAVPPPPPPSSSSSDQHQPPRTPSTTPLTPKVAAGPSPATPVRRPGGYSRRPMTAEEAKNKRLKNLFSTVFNHCEDDGHFPRDVFLHLPPHEQFPNYYKVIQDPIDLKMIEAKMERNEYASHQEMVSDLRRMLSNARYYNEEGSTAHNDALTLEQVIKRRLKSLGPYNGSNIIRSQESTPQSTGRRPRYSTPSVGTVASPSIGAPLPTTEGSIDHLAQLPLYQRLLFDLFQTVREYRSTDGRQLSTPFMRLPSRSELPSYYEYIQKPIEMESIAKQLLHGHHYTDFDSLNNDLFLMFNNACLFNEPESQIYLDTLTLHKVALAKRSQLLTAWASNLVLPPCLAPEIGSGIRRLLTNLHNAMLTACDEHGRGLVDSLIAGDGIETTRTSVTAARLALLHRAVAANAYRRLDHLQADWLCVLKRARIGDATTLQQRVDAADLARRWVRLRDELCHRPLSQPNGNTCLGACKWIIGSPTAFAYTIDRLDADITSEDSLHKLDWPVEAESEPQPMALGEKEVQLQHIDVDGKTYRVGDCVYVAEAASKDTTSVADTNQATSRRIGRIIGIIQSLSSGNSSTVKLELAWYWRPSEAKPSRRRRLLTNEVFRTSLSERVAVDLVVGSCLIVPIAHYVRFKPLNILERDVYVCESHYIDSSKTFVKIRQWTNPSPSSITFESRPTVWTPTRLPPNEPLDNALEQVDMNAHEEMKFPLPRPHRTVLATPDGKVKQEEEEGQDGKDEDLVFYAQYAHDNGFRVKLGDFLYVPVTIDSQDRHIVRVEKLWKSKKANAILFSGPWFILPGNIDHLPTQLFYPKEALLCTVERATHSLASATGKCQVMLLPDYIRARPTDYLEQDVYVCDSVYQESDKSIRKLTTGFEQFSLSSSDVTSDEFFFFPTELSPRKEASPLLVKAQPVPLDENQLKRPVATAYACVAASAGLVINTPLSKRLPGASQDRVDSPLGDSSSVGGKTGSRRKRKFRKPPSGYVIYAGEVRKRLLQERPEAAFGDISREVGLMWRQMPQSQRDVYEQTALQIKLRMEADQARIDQQQQQQQQMPTVAPPPQPLPQLMSPGIPPPGQPQQPPMQLFQTSTGQVIQIVHNTSVGGVVSTAPAQSSNNNLQQVLTSGGTSQLVAGPHQGAPPPQVLYQLAPGTSAGQPSVAPMLPAGTSGAPPTIAPGHHQPTLFHPSGGATMPTQLPHPNQQRLFVASSGTGQQLVNPPMTSFGMTVPFDPSATLAQPPMLMPTNGQQMAPVMTSGIPSLGGQSMLPSLGGTGAGGPIPPTMTIGSPAVMTVPPPLVPPQSTARPTGVPAMTTVGQPTLFVPPVQHAQSRITHSQTYLNYINRLRRSTSVGGSLSDWRKQLEPKHPGPTQSDASLNAVANSFFDPSRQIENVTEALYGLRDSLLEDALKIRVNCLSNSVDCL